MCKIPQSLAVLLLLSAAVWSQSLSRFGTESPSEAGPSFQAQAPYQLVRYAFDPARPESIAALLQAGHDITYFDGCKGVLELITPANAGLHKPGLTPEVIIPDLAAHARHLREIDYFQPFHTYEEMLAEMRDAVRRHPEIAALHDIGDSDDKVHGRGGYDIWALKISDEVGIEDAAEADALFMANLHAREIITPEIILVFMNRLLDNYGRDPYVTHLVDNRELWLIPTLNPDGHEHVFSGDIDAVTANRTSDPVWWRKNMRDNNNSGFFEYYFDGVDLNRNFGYEWGYDDIGSSPNPLDWTYRGPEPFSEPESQAVRDLVQAHDFVVSLSYHSYGRLWLYPWGYAAENPPDHDFAVFRALADSCVAYNGYRPGNTLSGAIYQVNGDTDDWLYGEAGIFAFTPEVGSVQQGRFWPDTSLIPVQTLENLGPNLYIAYAAGEEPLLEHQRMPDFAAPEPSYSFRTSIRPPLQLTQATALDIRTFTLYYSTIKEGPFESVPLEPVAKPDIYGAQVAGDDLYGWIYYYFEAGDVLGRTGTSPRAAPAAIDSFHVNFPLPVAADFQIPLVFDLSPNYPNPFNSGTRVRLTLSMQCRIHAAVYDALGRTVRVLEDGPIPAGEHILEWRGRKQNGNPAPSGLYILRVRSESSSLWIKMVLLR